MPFHSTTTLYEPGDVVKVRDDLVPYESAHDIRDWIYYRMQECYSGVVANKKMSALRGEHVTITHVINSSYRISEDDGRWVWTDEMFSGLADKTDEQTTMPDIDYDSFDWGE